MSSHVTDRQKDGQTDILLQRSLRYAYASHIKNVVADIMRRTCASSAVEPCKPTVSVVYFTMRTITSLLVQQVVVWSCAGGVAVTYYTQHVGHTCDVAHTTLTKQQREHIAAKLLTGVPVDDVLDSVHMSSATSAVSDMPLVSRKDVVNIANAYGINKGAVLHFSDDQLNVGKYIKTAEAAWSSVRTAMMDDRRIAKVVSQHMTKLNALVDALAHTADACRLPELPRSSEPSNKKVCERRHFRSTRKLTRRKQQLAASKPTHGEKEFLLRSLDGESPVISSQAPREHDYSADSVCHLVHFEHSFGTQQWYTTDSDVLC